MSKLKGVAVIEAIIIIILAILLFTHYSHTSTTTNKYPMLSSRISAGLLQPQSFLILNFEPLKKDINNYIADNNLNLSLFVENLRDGASFGINANKAFEPASLNKLPIAIIILREVEEGKLALGKPLTIKPEFRDNESGNLFATQINEMSIRDLLHYMLAESDNTAFKTLGSQVTLKDLQGLSFYLNYYNRDIDYTSATNNVFEISPKSTANLFLSLYLSTVLEPEDSELILEELANSTFDIKKYANLPANLTIAHKYGVHFTTNSSSFQDCGIMYIQDSRIFYCIMNSGLERDKTINAVGTVLNKIYNYIIEAKKIKDFTVS